MLVCSVQRCSGLEQHILALEQEPRATEEASISDSEAVSDSGDERCETAGLHLAVRPVVRQKGKHEQSVTWAGGILKQAPM